MRNSKKIIAAIVSVLLLAGCGSYSKETDSFNNVLKQYDMEIPNEGHCFVVIPEFSCYGCIQETWLWLEKNVNERPNYDMTVIDFNKDDVFVKKINCDVCFDTLGILNNVCFDMANPMIIKTSNKKIRSIISIDSRYIDETLESNLADYI